MDGGQAPHREQGRSQAEAAGCPAPSRDSSRAIAHRSMMPVRRPASRRRPRRLRSVPGSRRAVAAAAPGRSTLANLQAHYDRIADFRRLRAPLRRRRAPDHRCRAWHDARQEARDGVSTTSIPSPSSSSATVRRSTPGFPPTARSIVSPLPDGAGASTSAALLGRRGRPAPRLHRPLRGRPPPDGAWSIELRPVAGDAGYESLILTVDRTTLDIIEIATTDFQGGVST